MLIWSSGRYEWWHDWSQNIPPDRSQYQERLNPVYLVDGVIHYCVANMPGSVARTSTFALNNATLPFAVVLANKGTQKACSDNPHLRSGLNIYSGQVTHRAVAMALRLKYQDPQQALGI